MPLAFLHFVNCCEGWQAGSHLRCKNLCFLHVLGHGCICQSGTEQQVDILPSDPLFRRPFCHCQAGTEHCALSVLLSNLLSRRLWCHSHTALSLFLQEAMAASALADVMLQLFPADVPGLLVDTFRVMAGLVAHPAVPASGVNVKVINVMEGFLEVRLKSQWACMCDGSGRHE